LPERVIIDEVQKVPLTLEEVHRLLENTEKRFILSGSGARKLKRGACNSLGGRATEHRLMPLTSNEVPKLDLDKMLNHGGLPSHYLLDNQEPLLRSSINTYLKEEIVDESLAHTILVEFLCLDRVFNLFRRRDFLPVSCQRAIRCPTVKGPAVKSMQSSGSSVIAEVVFTVRIVFGNR
jgi:hypothetical protein